jgi:LysR family glycine cleavage system transcriptional activator
MAQNLPPLAAVRAFEAAARHLSFTKAAAELGMTQAAVSYQVRLLEEKLGVSLFLRKPRKVRLTDAGAHLASRATEAFDILRDAVAMVDERAEDTLVISSNTTFATNWLATCVGDFQMRHPSLAVRMIPYNRGYDVGEHDSDVAIVACAPADPKTRRHRLIRGGFTPMLSPELAATVGGVREPADLLKLPIISPNDPWWGHWFKAAGIPDCGLPRGPDNVMGAQMIEATQAMAGQGVAILTPYFYREALRRGDLIQPFELVCDIGITWDLVYPETRRNARKIRLFRDWLLPQMPDADED